MVNMTNSTLNQPYPIFNITESISNGQFETFFTLTNSFMDYLPFRIVMLALLVVFYQIGVWVQPQTSRFKLFSFAGISVTILIGMLSFGGFLPILDAIPYAILSSIAWFMGKGD